MTRYFTQFILLLCFYAADAAIESVNEQDKPASEDSLLPSLMQASRLNLMRMKQEQQASTPPQFDYYDAVREEDSRLRQQMQQLRKGQFIPRAMVLESEPNFSNGRVFRFLQPNRNQQQQVPQGIAVEGDTYDDASTEKQARPQWPAIVRPVAPLTETSTTPTDTVQTATDNMETVPDSTPVEVSGAVNTEENEQHKTGSLSDSESSVSETSSAVPLLDTNPSASTAVEIEASGGDTDGTASTPNEIPSSSAGSTSSPSDTSVAADATESPATSTEEPMPDPVVVPRFNRAKRTMDDEQDQFPPSDAESGSLPAAATKLVPYDAHIHPDFPAEAPVARGLYNIPLGHNLDKLIDQEFRAGYRHVPIMTHHHPKEDPKLDSEASDPSLLDDHQAHEDNAHRLEMEDRKVN